MTLIAQNSFLARQARLIGLLHSTQVDALVLNPSETLTYLTGLHFHLSERPIVAIFSPNQPMILVLPQLELLKAEGLPFPIKLYPFGEDPLSWENIFRSAFQAAGLKSGRVGVEPNHLRYLELNLMQSAAPQINFVSAEKELDNLRICKDEQELSAMRIAADIAQRALQASLPKIMIGMTEVDLATELTFQLLQHGSTLSAVFSPIVSFGPNTANAHATPSERKLAIGDNLLCDWGAVYQGYSSDITRTFAIREPDAEMVRIARIVQEANAAGRAMAGPGVSVHQVDQAARQVIEKAGYGPNFPHRTGHGLGMEVHEPPYIRSDSSFRLEPGMVFTIEPGIYLPGRGGVRIEDDCVITSEGVETITNLPRELLVLAL